MLSNYSREKINGIKILACATVIEEMRPLMPKGVSSQKLDFGLHVNPGSLKTTIQRNIDAVPENIHTIILGYGLCSQAVIGLKSERCRLVVPRVDDCIAIFLGSAELRQEQHKNNPGTYYVTKGWLKGGSPFSEYDAMVKKYGSEAAGRIYNLMLKNYTRLVFIATGKTKLVSYRNQAKSIAARFGLQYEEIKGDDTLIKKMVYGPWNDDFVVVDPGRPIQFNDFYKTTDDKTIKLK